MKKLWAMVIIVAFIGTAAFAQEADSAAEEKASTLRISIGAGGALNANFATWFVDKDAPGDLYRYNSSSLGTAPYLLLDLRYIEVNVGLGIGKTGNFHSDNPLESNPHFPARTLSLRGGVYVKLPFALSDRFTLYPLAGAEYELFLAAFKGDDRDAKFPVSASNQNADPLEALSAVSFKVGVGLDTAFTEHWFLRTELLYGLRLPNKFEQYQNDVYTDVDSKLFHGGDFKIAIGYRF
jgi:opacity protein-like surface antigen